MMSKKKVDTQYIGDLASKDVVVVYGRQLLSVLLYSIPLYLLIKYIPIGYLVLSASSLFVFLWIYIEKVYFGNKNK